MTSHHDVAGLLPVIPDDDSDFTPDLARKIVAKYQALLESQAKALSEHEVAYDGLMKAKETFRAEAHRNAARALAAEARLAEAMKALTAIAEHPKSYNDGKRSYAVGWAFWNVQNIARAFTNAAKEKT